MHTRLTAHTAIALTLLAAVLAVSGCGSSSKTKTSAASTASSAAASTTAANVNTSTAPSPADAAPKFKASVESICAQRNHVIASVTKTIESTKDLMHVMGNRAAVEKATLKALGKVSVPASLTAPWRQFMGFRRDVIKAEMILAREGLRKDKGTEIHAVAKAQQEMADAAKREGFSACSQPG